MYRDTSQYSVVGRQSTDPYVHALSTSAHKSTREGVGEKSKVKPTNSECEHTGNDKG